MFYWSKLYGESIKVGERYINAKRTIIILFTDYEIKGHEKIKKYISKWQIREEEYKEIILTKNLEIYIIELPKCERYKRKPEEIDMEDMNNNKALKKAKEVLEEISGDEREKELAFQRLMYKMDQEAIEVAGYDRGIERGIEQGIQQGMEEIAKRMLKDNLDIEFIMQYTGLTNVTLINNILYGIHEIN